MNTWTKEDCEKGWCAPQDVGQPKTDHERWSLSELETQGLPGYLVNTIKPPSAWCQQPKPIAPPASPADLVQTYLDVFHEIGGKQSLVEFARKNPMKFYDQLLKLLVALEAAPQTQINIANISDNDLHSLSIAQLTRLLLDHNGVSPEEIRGAIECEKMS